MKKNIILLSTLLWSISGISQYVGLRVDEVKKISQLVKTNAAAGKLFGYYQKTAESALLENPNPRDTIVSEGHLATHPDKIASVIAMKDYNKIYALAIMYETTQQKQYSKKATEYLVAWANINHPTGNPINDTKFDNVFEAYDMLRKEMNGADKKTIDNWLIAIAEKEIKTGVKGKTSSMNNWHSHRLKVVGQIGFILDNKVYKDYATQGLLTQINNNLNEDGTSWDFLERDALHYHAYDLEPMLTLSIIIKRATGTDDFVYVSPKGTSIKKSVDWFVPFVTGEKVHPEFVKSKVAFDLARAKNGEKGYAIGNNFDPKNGLSVLYSAAYFNVEYLNILKSIKPNDNNFPDWQLVLNKVMF